jgi:hypothetical protein
LSKHFGEPTVFLMLFLPLTTPVVIW